MARVIVLDANVLIAFLDRGDPFHEPTKNFLEHNFVEGFGASALTVAEALVHPSKAGKEDHARQALTQLGLKILGLEAPDAVSLAKLRAHHSIRMPDVVVLHCALSVGARVATFDKRLRGVVAHAGVQVVLIEP